jgi:hypothetical protein
MLLSLYIVLAVAVTTRVLTKWKTVAFETLLKHERSREQMSIDGYEAELNYNSGSRIDDMQQQLAYSSSNAAAGGSSSGSTSSADRAVGVTGVMLREGAGGMLTVKMRPRSPTAAATTAAMQDDASGDADAHEEGIRESPGPIGGLSSTVAGVGAGASEGSRGSSSSRSSSSSRRQRSGKWFVGKSADDLERLLLPLDG